MTSGVNKVKGRLRAGTATVNITPPVGVEISGWAFGHSRGILDELYAKALVLDDGKKKVAIITTDLIGIDRKYVSRIRLGIRKSSGIEPGDILVGASHTHSGPAAMYLRRWGEIDKEWIGILQSKLIALVETACANMCEARIGRGWGRLDSISHNRRVKEGPIDPEVGVLRIDDSNGDMIAVLFNFACHPVALHNYKGLISADYPGYAMRLIERAKEEKVMALFTNGAAGDVNPYPDGVENRNPRIAERMGTILGNEVLRVAEQIETTAQVDLRVESQRVRLPLMKLPERCELEKMVKESTERLKELERKKSHRTTIVEARISLEWAREALEAVRKGQTKRSITTEIQVIAINNLALVAIPGEVLVEIGLDIKKTSNRTHAFIIELANGSIGYIPTAKAFGRGLYEATRAYKVYGLYSLTPDVGDRVKGAVRKLLKACC